MNQEQFRPDARRALLVAGLIGAAALALSGCSSFVGHKLPPDGGLGPGQQGVPYVMTRPEYMLAIAADPKDENKEVFTLTKTDVPDPLHRYSLRLDPAWLVDGKFDLTLGELGNFGESTVTTTSRAVTILQAVVSAAIQSRAPGVAAKDQAGLLSRIDLALDDKADLACQLPANADDKGGKSAKGTKTPPAPATSVREAIGALIKDLRARARIELQGLDKDKLEARVGELAFARLHYLDALQRECLQKLPKRVVDQAQDTVKRLANTYDGAVAEAGKLDPKPAELAPIVKAVTDHDIDALKRQADKAPDSLKKVVETAQLLTAEQALLDDIRAYLLSLVEMPPEVWRARHLAYVDAQLTTKGFERFLVNDPNSAAARETDRAIAALQADWAATLDVSDIVKRIAKIDVFLTEIRVTTNPGGAAVRFAADEHVRLREERDLLQTRLDQKHADLLAKNKVLALKTAEKPATPKKVVPRKDVPVKLVHRDFIDAAATIPAAKLSEQPEFVLVLKPVREPTVLPMPSPAASGATP